MVSPHPPPPNQPTFSYADRARNVPKPHNLLSQRPSIVSEHAAASNMPHSSTSTSDAFKPSSLIPSAGITSNPSILPTRADPSPASPTSPVGGPAVCGTNGDVTSTIPTKTAPINVWNLRMEQMAQARASSRPVQSHSQNNLLNSARDLPDNSSVELPNPNSTATQNGLSFLAINGNTDPFATRTLSQALAADIPRAPALVNDMESWPEVGQSVVSSSKGTTQHRNDVSESTAEQGRKDDEPSTSLLILPKKSEKTKWVLIPPEELQAAAEASQPAKRSESHSPLHSHHPQHSTHPRHPSAHPGSSTYGSQGSSKDPSRVASTNHSRIHSQASSAQSSPKHHARGRRLPMKDMPVGGMILGSAGARGNEAGRADVTITQQRSSRKQSPQASIHISPTFVPTIPFSADTYSVGGPDGAMHYIPHSHIAAPQPNPPHEQATYEPYSRPGPNGYPNYVPQGYPPGQHIYSHYGYYGQPYAHWSVQEQVAMYPPYASIQAEQQRLPQQRALHNLEGSLPSPTMIANPRPPPRESDAIAGYRELAPTTSRKLDNMPSVGIAVGARGRRADNIVFGSIGVSGSSETLSPILPAAYLVKRSENNKEGIILNAEEDAERPVMKFSIGVAPGEAGPSQLRPRRRSQARTRGEIALASSLGSGVQESQESSNQAGAEGKEGKEVKVIDLTDPETKWEFGTTRRAQGKDAVVIPASSLNLGPVNTISNPVSVVATGGAPFNVGMLFSGPSQPSPQRLDQPSPPSLQHPPHIPIPLDNLQLHTGMGPHPVRMSSQQPLSGESTDEWEVKDFGYGFGRASGTGYAPVLAKEERMRRERERERERERGKESKERERETAISADGAASGFGTRPRRGSYSGHMEPRRGYGGYERGGFGHDRGGYGERGYVRGRGRGMGAGYGRAWSHGASRGGFRGYSNDYVPSHQSPPFTVAPPLPPLQTLPLNASTPTQGEIFYPPQQEYPAYIPLQGYEEYAYQPYVPAFPPPSASVAASVTPPQLIPRPISELTFPLDPTRYHLLAQLEYYLSPQNLASDFFLRQQMDSRGWVSIQLLASFNRVKQLTMDLLLVREMLTLSTILEVSPDGEHTRVGAGQWVQFVLPTATTSVVEGGLDTIGVDEAEGLNEGEDANVDGEDGDVGEEEVEEDDEDEVEFVMGGEAGQLHPWVVAS